MNNLSNVQNITHVILNKVLYVNNTVLYIEETSIDLIKLIIVLFICLVICICGGLCYITNS